VANLTLDKHILGEIIRKKRKAGARRKRHCRAECAKWCKHGLYCYVDALFLAHRQ
jgi:hypothetical protein